MVLFPLQNYDHIIYLSHFFGTERYRKWTRFFRLFNSRVFTNQTFIEEEHRPPHGYNIVLKGNYLIQAHLAEPPEHYPLYNTAIDKKYIGDPLYKGKYITVIPFTSAEFKDYPLPQLVQVMDRLIEKYGVHVVVPVPLLTDFYYKYRDAFARFRIVQHNHSEDQYGKLKTLSTHPENIHFVQTADTVDLINCVNYSSFQLSMDSGPWHVAISLDTPSLALFKNYDPAWHYEAADVKYDNLTRQKVLYPESCGKTKLSEIPPERILAEIEKLNTKLKLF
jgi:ADP-heptose:LPS heptosyltransferase